MSSIIHVYAGSIQEKAKILVNMIEKEKQMVTEALGDTDGICQFSLVNKFSRREISHQ